MSDSVLSRFEGRRILVVGDVMLDAYQWGFVRRISPEAPVPVVSIRKKDHAPGGAANTAANVAALGAESLLVGVLGADTEGKHLLASLTKAGVRTDGLLIDPERLTTSKTRIVAQCQHVVRIDQEEEQTLCHESAEKLIRLVEERLPLADACILSDYAKGILSPSLTRGLIRRARSLGKPVIVDPKGNDYARYQGATLFKPNLLEATAFLHRDIHSPEDVIEAGQTMLAALEVQAVLLTRGPDGMVLFQREREPLHIPALAREVFDVTGAGDTVASILALAIASGASLEVAARLATRAAAIAVSRVGTVSVTLADLRHANR